MYAKCMWFRVFFSKFRIDPENYFSVFKIVELLFHFTLHLLLFPMYALKVNNLKPVYGYTSILDITIQITKQINLKYQGRI